MKRKLASILVVGMFFSFTISSVAAFTPPGLAKKGGLPPGIQKKLSHKSWWNNEFWDDDEWDDEFWDDDEWEDMSFESWKDLIEELKERFEGEVIDKEYKTTLEEVDARDRRILIKDGTAHIYLSVAEDAEIELNDKDIRLSSLSDGDEVYLKLNEDNTVTEIEVIQDSDKEETVTIEEANVDYIDHEDRRITLKYDDTRKRYIVDENAIIISNKSREDLDYIEEDMKVDVVIKDGKITLINVIEKIEEYEGKLINEYSNDNGDYILIEIDEVPTFFYVDEDLRISSRLIDEEVYIEVKDDVVIDIEKK